MFQTISTGWKSANKEYNKVFHPNDSSKTNQDSLANIAVGVGAGLVVGVGIIALAPVIGVSVGGALGIGAVCLTTTVIGAGIGVAIGFIPQEAEKSMRTPSASQDRSPNSPRSQESAENPQAYTLNNFGNKIIEKNEDKSAGSPNTSAGKPPENEQALTAKGNGGAGGGSTQVLQQGTSATLAEQSKVAGAVAGTERLHQANEIKEDDTSKSSVAASSSPTLAQGATNGGGGNGTSTSVIGGTLLAGGAGVRSTQDSQQATHAQSGAVELSTVGPESPPIPDNTQAASSPSTQRGAIYDGSPATSPVAAVVSNKQPIIEFKSTTLL